MCDMLNAWDGLEHFPRFVYTFGEVDSRVEIEATVIGKVCVLLRKDAVGQSNDSTERICRRVG